MKFTSAAAFTTAMESFIKVERMYFVIMQSSAHILNHDFDNIFV